MLPLCIGTFTSLQCSGDEVRTFYRNNCCTPDNVFDTKTQCTDDAQGTSTRYIMECRDAKPFLTSQNNCGRCDNPTSNDVCNRKQEFHTCVVGGGIGAYGALLGYRAGGGNMKDVMVFERGRDTSLFAAQAEERGGQYPSMSVTASNGPWPYACVDGHMGPCSVAAVDWNKPHAWYNGQQDTPVFGLTYKGSAPTWFSVSNAFGGNFQWNGGLFFHGPDAETGLTAVEIEGLRTVASNLGIANGTAVCDASPGCKGIIDAFHGLSETYGVRVMGGASTVSSETSTRIDLQRQTREKVKGQYRTGVAVAHVQRQPDGAYELKDGSDATVATCDNVILAGGAFMTPKLFQSSFPNVCADAGKYLMNHYGVISVGTFYHADAFTLGTSIAPPSGYFDAFPYFVPDDNLSHTITLCSATGDGIGVQCNIIVYGALQNDAQYASSEGNNVTVDGDIHYTYTPDAASTASYVKSGSAAVDALEAYYQSLGAYPGTYISVNADYTITGKKAGGHYQTIDVTDVADIAAKAMNSTEMKESIADKMEHELGYAIYHEMGTMSACVATDTNKVTEYVFVGDASASKHGFVGSTAALSSIHGYKAGKAAAAA